MQTLQFFDEPIDAAGADGRHAEAGDDSENVKGARNSKHVSVHEQVNLVETYFPGNVEKLTSRSRVSISWSSSKKDRFSVLSVSTTPSEMKHHSALQDAVPPLLVVFVCIIAAILGFAVAGLHDMIKYVGCPLGINGCNSFYGEAFEKKGYILPRALEGVPEDVIYIVMATVCLLLIGAIADLAPPLYGKQVLGGGTVQSLLAVAAGVPIPFRCALLRVLITALYFLGGGTMGGDGPTIQVCTSLSCMIGWVCGIRSPRTQSLLASLGFCCGFASSFNAPLSGILFAMEELQHVSSRLTTRVLCIILIGSVVSTSVMRGFLGNKVLFLASHPDDLETMVSGASVNRIYGQSMWMLIALPIGLTSALVGYCFSKAFHYIHKFVTKVALKLIPRWLLFGVVGALVACIGSVVFRLAQLRGVWGIGFRSLQEALNENFDVDAGHLLIFTVGKLAAFALSVSCRFPGDTLEPVLISGAFLGAAIGRMLPKEIAGDSDSACEIFGMVGLFASCFRFPLTPVVFAIELTGTRTYNLVLPTALSCFAGLQLSNYLFEPILEQLLHQDNIDLEAVAELAELAELSDDYDLDDDEQNGSEEHSPPQSPRERRERGDSGDRKTAFQTIIGRLEESMLDVSNPSLPERRTSNEFRTSGRNIRRSSLGSGRSSELKHVGSGRSSGSELKHVGSSRSSGRSRRSSRASGSAPVKLGTSGTCACGDQKTPEAEIIEDDFQGETQRV